MANKMLTQTAYVLAGVGAITWGTVEFLDFNVVNWVAGYIPGSIPVTMILYGAVAASGIYVLMDKFK